MMVKQKKCIQSCPSTVYLSFLVLFIHLDNDGKLRVEDSHAHVQISLGGQEMPVNTFLCPYRWDQGMIKEFQVYIYIICPLSKILGRKNSEATNGTWWI